MRSLFDLLSISKNTAFYNLYLYLICKIYTSYFKTIVSTVLLFSFFMNQVMKLVPYLQRICGYKNFKISNRKYHIWENFCCWSTFYGIQFILILVKSPSVLLVTLPLHHFFYPFKTLHTYTPACHMYTAAMNLFTEHYSFVCLLTEELNIILHMYSFY